MEKITLFLLSATLLLGMGVSYYRKTNPPFSLRVVSPAATLQAHEAVFETSKQVSLTQGSVEDFTRLPNVGPKLAKRIVTHRETHGFQKKEDLLDVQGIGAKTYRALEDLLVVE